MTSYHVHTQWSDGEPTIAEVIAQARELQLIEVGISDHFVVHPGGLLVDWSMRPDDLHQYVAQVQAEVAKANPITVRLGIEVDFLPESLGETHRRLAGVPFDYIIGSVHYVDGFPVDGHHRYWDALTEEEEEEVWRSYYQRVREMAATRAFDVVAHLDLPKKFGHLPKADLRNEALSALDAVAESGMVMELNTSGWHKTCREIYPAPWLVEEARRRDIPIIITADAHNRRHLTRDFDRALQVARAAGYDSVVRFRQRERHAVPLG